MPTEPSERSEHLYNLKEAPADYDLTQLGDQIDDEAPSPSPAPESLESPESLVSPEPPPSTRAH